MMHGQPSIKKTRWYVYCAVRSGFISKQENRLRPVLKALQIIHAARHCLPHFQSLFVTFLARNAFRTGDE